MSIGQSILIVDSDESYLASLARGESEFSPLLASSVEQAIEQIKDRQHSLRGLYLSVSDNSGDWVSVLSEFNKHRAGAPSFLVYNEDRGEMINVDAAAELGARGAMVKTGDFSALVEKIKPLKLEADAEANLRVVDLTMAGEFGDGGFYPVRADCFLTSHPSNYDIFVQLSEKKFFKICGKGLRFDELRISNYLSKGLTYFYIRKEVHEKYLSSCADYYKVAMASAETVSEKLDESFKYGSEVADYLRSIGVQDAEIKYAREFVQNVEKYLETSKADTSEFLQKFSSDVESYDHGVGVALLAALVGKNMGFSGTDGGINLGLAALFHDIAMIGLPQEIRDEDESSMSLKSKTVYRKHPELGAKILSTIPGIERAVVEAVANHHVRKDQKGFPVGVAFPVSETAQIVGICHEFSYWIARSKSNQKSLGDRMRDKVFPGFSDNVIEAFLKTFDI